MHIDSSVLPLFEGEELLSHVHVPFEHNRPSLGLDLLALLMTDGGTKMPLGSRALDASRGEGLFEAEFGRDALTMAAFASELMPQATVATVIRLAELQGVEDKTQNGSISDGEEVGRIIHEQRPSHDPIAKKCTKQWGWAWPYFGSVDATPLFVSAVMRAAQVDPEILDVVVTQRDEQQRTIAQAMQRAVEWIEKRLATSPTGLLDSPPASNNCWQVWEDSKDAYHHADGTLAQGRVASIEVQGFVYDALMSVGKTEEAAALHNLVMDQFWLSEKGGYFAAGLEYNNGVATPLAVRKANMGVVLNSGLLDEGADDHVACLVEQLTDTNGLMSPSGIRTLAADETRFRPQAYHNGTIWPWQNLWIARGLRRHGYVTEARAIEDKMVRIFELTGCAPEYIMGGSSTMPDVVEDIVTIRSLDGHGGTFDHTLMQPAQKFQGWTAFGLLSLQRDIHFASADD